MVAGTGVAGQGKWNLPPFWSRADQGDGRNSATKAALFAAG
jgi:hypothetical protein